MILCLLGLLGVLQQPMDTYSLRAVVSDSKSVPVRNLEALDVSLTAGGVTLPLTRFEPDDRPARVALLVDSSRPMASVYRVEFVRAARSFVAALPSNTHVAVWTTGDRPIKVIDDLDLSREGTSSELESRLARVPPSGGNTILDAIVEAAEDLERAEGERKIVVFLTGQGPGFSNDSRQGIVDRVLETGVEVAGVMATEQGEPTAGGELSRDDYDFVFGELTERTGGRFERPLTTMGASTLLARVAADLRSTYRLSFHFRGAKVPRLELQIARPGVKVRLSTPRKENPSQ